MGTEFTQALSRTNFTSFDWVIVVIYLSISVVIGLFVKKYVRNMTTYLEIRRHVAHVFFNKQTDDNGNGQIDDDNHPVKGGEIGTAQRLCEFSSHIEVFISSMISAKRPA